jgi:predicted GH43/DUF377 family glycosyl hydrolase
MPDVTVRRIEATVVPNSAKVVGRPYVPGDDPAAVGTPRLARIVAGVRSMTEDQVDSALDDVHKRFVQRHRDLDRMIWQNASRVEHLLDGLSEQRRCLVGAYLTQEYAFQAAAVTNPSMVPAPDQSGVEPGAMRFVMSMRAIGEGHISSIAFRTGVVSGDGSVALDDDDALAETGERRTPVYERGHFANKLGELGADPALTERVVDQLDRRFGPDELEAAIATIEDLPRAVTYETVQLMRWFAASNYLLRFDATTTPVQQRLLWPEGPFESKGMEDARFVRFADPSGSTTYYATYTAYDGFEILPQLIQTDDFCSFEMSTMSGQSAQNKGMALFPRTIDGTHMALSRPDRENIHIMRSPDPRAWHEPSTPLRRPLRQWELVQMGNCGSPIETEDGWLVLTHGVGPLRTYRMGAMLLDLEQPDRVIGDLSEPILEAADDERDGYVPNVVYSCGALLHGDHLVVPYGVSDQSTRFAIFSLAELLGALAASAERSGV